MCICYLACIAIVFLITTNHCGLYAESSVIADKLVNGFSFRCAHSNSRIVPQPHFADDIYYQVYVPNINFSCMFLKLHVQYYMAQLHMYTNYSLFTSCSLSPIILDTLSMKIIILWPTNHISVMH